MLLKLKIKNRHEICELLACLCHGNKRRHGLHDSAFSFKDLTFSAKGAMMTTLTVKDTDVPGTASYTFNFLDSKKKKAKVDVSKGPPTVVASDPTVVDVVGPVVDNGDDTFTTSLHILDNPGAANITVDGDADLGDGVTDVQFVDVVSVIPGDAVTGQGTFGPVTPDTPPA